MKFKKKEDQIKDHKPTKKSRNAFQYFLHFCVLWPDWQTDVLNIYLIDAHIWEKYAQKKSDIYLNYRLRKSRFSKTHSFFLSIRLFFSLFSVYNFLKYSNNLKLPLDVNVLVLLLILKILDLLGLVAWRVSFSFSQ